MIIHYNLREQVLNEIGKRIIAGELAPGAVLPREDALSEEFGVSRTVIREAIKGLSARGLVESRPKVGTIVKPRDNWQMLDPDVMEWVAESEPDGAFMLRLAEVRLAIEPATAALAARHASEADLIAMREAFSAMEAAVDDEDAWAEADLVFHASIVAASHNDLLAYIVRSLRKPLHSRRRLTVPMQRLINEDSVAPPYTSATEETLERHKAVLDAILARDETAAHAAATTLLARVADMIQQASDRSNR